MCEDILPPTDKNSELHPMQQQIDTSMTETSSFECVFVYLIRNCACVYKTEETSYISVSVWVWRMIKLEVHSLVSLSITWLEYNFPQVV